MNYSKQQDSQQKNQLKLQLQNLPPLGNAPLVLGIDEAGRGPVLGPMVYAVAFASVSDTNWLKQLQVADSKSLTEARRDEIYHNRFLDAQNKSRFGWIAISLSPQEISSKMLQRNKYNLNLLSHDTALELVRRVISAGYTVDQVYVDTVGDPIKYTAKIKEAFPSIPTVVVSTKADAKFPIVSAASIVAKVTRDWQLKHWHFNEKTAADFDFGSGYPADPNTVQWLSRNFSPVFGFPSVIRFSWSTGEKIIQEKGAPVYWKYDEESTGGPASALKKTFSKSASSLAFKRPLETSSSLFDRKTFLTKRHIRTSLSST